MKKLMIAAAAAAMVGGVYAADPVAQVYDVSLTIKTTKAATAKKVTNKTNPLAVKDADKYDIVYRAQTSVTWKGLIWGCDCESIDGVWENAEACGDISCTVKGCVLWDVKGKAPVYFGNGVDDNGVDLTNDETLFDTVAGCGWGWDFLQCIGKDAKAVEGAWEIFTYGADPCDDTATMQWFKFRGAGFGTANLVTYKDDSDDHLVCVECESWIKSISGNFAGWMMAPAATVGGSWGCSFCGGGTWSFCDYADVWAWCEDFNDDVCNCNVNLFDDTRTAAYGTWSIKYNSSLSKKLTNASSILEAYNFKSLPKVAAKIAIAEEASNYFLQAIRDGKEGVKAAEEAVAAAKDDLATKTAAVEVAEAAKKTAETQLAAAMVVQNAYGTEMYDLLKAQYEMTWGEAFDLVAVQDKAAQAAGTLGGAVVDKTTAAAAVTAAEQALVDAKEALKAAEEDCEEYCK